MAPLTKPERRVLDGIIALTQRDVCPTYRELASHLGYKGIGVLTPIIDSLAYKGYIRRCGKVRGIEVLKGHESLLLDRIMWALREMIVDDGDAPVIIGAPGEIRAAIEGALR